MRKQVNPHCQEGDKSRNPTVIPKKCYFHALFSKGQQHIIFSSYRRQGAWQVNKKDLVPVCRAWSFQGYRQYSLLTAKVRKKNKTKPTHCTFSLATAAALPHQYCLQYQWSLIFIPLNYMPGCPLLKAIASYESCICGGEARSAVPAAGWMPCRWVCRAGVSWFPAPATFAG